MGYLHIDNLYKNKAVLLFKEVYVLEKIHGTSAHVRYENGELFFHHGGESRENFLACFNQEELLQRFKEHQLPAMTIYGEAYGGKQQKQAHRYGPKTRFVAFDVALKSKLDETKPHWLTVPHAERICQQVGLEFVHYVKTNTDIDNLNALRDGPSVQAVRNGITEPMTQEGIVIKPLEEFLDTHGQRIIAKHKRDDFRETFQPRRVNLGTNDLEVLTKANEIALEWVTDMRLEHVLQKLPQGIGLDQTRAVIDAMLEDVLREASGEIVDTREARKAICARAAQLFKAKITNLDAA